MDLLDPWCDAARIAHRLQNDRAIFVAVIGAQSWCQKCRDLYPVWQELAQDKLTGALCLWLDLDEHQEFVGDFVPDDLPWLLIYHEDRLLVSSAVLYDTLAMLPEEFQLLQFDSETSLPDPGVRARLLRADWAGS